MTFDRFNLYRGSVARLLSTGEYTQDPGAEPEAASWCALPGNFQSDLRRPSASGANFYLVSGAGAEGESSLGMRSDGTERANTRPCP